MECAGSASCLEVLGRIDVKKAHREAEARYMSNLATSYISKNVCGVEVRRVFGGMWEVPGRSLLCGGVVFRQGTEWVCGKTDVSRERHVESVQPRRIWYSRCPGHDDTSWSQVRAPRYAHRACLELHEFRPRLVPGRGFLCGGIVLRQATEWLCAKAHVSPERQVDGVEKLRLGLEDASFIFGNTPSSST